ncbi:MAG: hypothetical protein RL145_953 [Pseudomonadota bacterium]|jgi:hypothetical protein
MRILALTVLTLTTFASVPSFAQDSKPSDNKPGEVYGGIGYSYYDVGGDVYNGAAVARIGYQVTPKVAIEAEGGIGVKDDELFGVTIETRGTLGAYAVITAPVDEHLSVIFRAGYQHIWIEGALGSVKAQDDDGSLGVGIGIQHMFTDSSGVRADYTRYTKGSGTNSYAVNYIQKF